jgi:hypothetical protein
MNSTEIEVLVLFESGAANSPPLTVSGRATTSNR